MNEIARPDGPLVVNGWSIYAHPIFLSQLDRLIKEVEVSRNRNPKTWEHKNCTKRVAAILRLVTEVIPADPGARMFRQGSMLGGKRKHWFRAKFFQQYRLFYRFSSSSKTIVLVWVNDRSSLRARSSRTDAYATFRGKLERGRRREDFEELMKEAEAEAAHFLESLSKTQLR